MLPLAFPYFLENGRDLELLGLVIGVIFWFQMIRFCLRHEPPSPHKMGWVALMIVLPGIGSLLYYFLRVARPRG
jgi:hypothetical protein